MNNTTYSIKKSEIERKWYIIDAENKPSFRIHRWNERNNSKRFIK